MLLRHFKSPIILVLALGFSTVAFAAEPRLRASGLVDAEGVELVEANCGACHSLKLVTQNRANSEGWLQMIRWMQETQRLWPLGEHEPVILDYLSTHYAPISSGRRKPLPAVEFPAASE